MEFKGREQRTQCYKARDIYYDCLDKNLPPDTKTNTDIPACKQLLKEFEQACGKKWCEHFIRKRDYLKFKEKIEKEGVEAVDKAKI